MNEAIEALLNPAVGIAISPFPIVGLILILLSKRARLNSVFYSIGWVVGNATIFLLAMFLMGQAIGTGEPGFWKKFISIALGLLLIIMAIKNFVGRPKKGQKAKTPGWFKKISATGPIGATGFSFVLSALNPKNLLLGVSAGVAVGALNPTGSVEFWSTIIFLLIASMTIVVPTIAFLLAGHRLDKVLDDMREWLIQNNAVIMSILLLMIGLSIISKAF